MSLDRRGRLLEVNREDLIDAAKKYVLDPMVAGKSSKVVFGTNGVDLSRLREEGWKIEDFNEGLSLRKKLYEEGDEDQEHRSM